MQKDNRQFLAKLTNNEQIINELINYCTAIFEMPELSIFKQLPLIDELHVKTWRSYQQEAAELQSVFDVLTTKIVQFNFPIEKDISLLAVYKNATLRGYPTRWLSEATGLRLEAPQGLQLIFKNGLVGNIPILIVPNKKDFDSVLQALVYRNEPFSIPSAMGASIIKGLNNWDRIRENISRYRNQYPKSPLSELKIAIFKQPILYQDTFILASQKPYSNIYPSNYEPEQWIIDSLSIRIQHEYAHYFTQRFFGKMRNHLHDELMADYLGLHAIQPYFKADLFLLFIGLENYPAYRKGGRMENYISNPPISPPAFKILQKIIIKAAYNLEKLDYKLGPSPTSKDLSCRFLAISQLGLADIACTDGVIKLFVKYKEIQSQWV